MTIGHKPILQDRAEGEFQGPDENNYVEARESKRKKSVYREMVETIVLTLLIFFLVRAVVQNFKVEGYSMEPSLHTGQYLLVNKLVYFRFDSNALRSLFLREKETEPNIVYPFHPPQRGDVVVFEYPQDPSRDFIKRVIAVAGETVEVKNRRVLVNGVALSEPYIKDAPVYSMAPITVPQGNVFVLGDNRNNSSDSHVWGTLPIGNIIGKAWIRYWPPNQWGFLPQSQPAAANQQ